MNKFEIAYLVVCGVLIAGCSIAEERGLLPTRTATETVQPATQNEWACISEFDDFLYQMVRISSSDPRYHLEPIYPPSPWEFSAAMPEAAIGSIRTELQVASGSSGQTALWIRSGINTIRYDVETDDFLVISASPYDQNGKEYTSVRVNNLIELATGEIIGVNHPEHYETVWGEALPLFSIYNEDANRFEFYNTGLIYRAEQIGFGYVGLIPRYGVLISQSGPLIWIYQQEDGLYSYNPLNSELRHYETSFAGVVQRMVSSPDGFLLFSEKIESLGRLMPSELKKYLPSSQAHEEIGVPIVRWPDYGTLLYTDSGDLWIGIHGYLSSDGIWVLENPNRRSYVNLGWSSHTYNWQQPDLLFQSSNGYLWYSNDKHDGLGVNGAAWYDPETEQGCWFTTEPGSILEDSFNTLWMLTDGIIYRYELSQ